MNEGWNLKPAMPRGRGRMCRAALALGVAGFLCGPQALGQQNGAGGERPRVVGGASMPRTPPSQVPPPVRFEPEVLDFGDLRPDTKAEGVFTLHNVGDAPLRITAALTGCWCTVAEIREREIPPGGSAPIPVTFEAGPGIAYADREVMLRMEGYSQSARAMVRARVHYGVRVSLEYESEDRKQVGFIELEDPEGRPFRVVSVNFASPVFVDGFDPSADEPRHRYRVGFDFERMPLLTTQRWYIIELDHPTSPVVDVPIENPLYEPQRVRRPWLLGEDRVLLGNMRAGTERDIYITMTNAEQDGLDLVQDVVVDPPVVRASIMGMQPVADGMRVRVRVRAEEGSSGLVYAALRLLAQGHEEETVLMGRITGDE